MNKEEVKQYLRNQIDSSVKTPDKYNKDVFYLSYNNSYVRALKLSTITGKPVNKNDFKGGEKLFWFNTKNKTFCYYSKIRVYLGENYSNDYTEQGELIEEVLNEYSEYAEYKAYKWGGVVNYD